MTLEFSVALNNTFNMLSNFVFRVTSFQQRSAVLQFIPLSTFGQPIVLIGSYWKHRLTLSYTLSDGTYLLEAQTDRQVSICKQATAVAAATATSPGTVSNAHKKGSIRSDFYTCA